MFSRKFPGPSPKMPRVKGKSVGFLNYQPQTEIPQLSIIKENLSPWCGERNDKFNLSASKCIQFIILH